jgi:hypothetical protein
MYNRPAVSQGFLIVASLINIVPKICKLCAIGFHIIVRSPVLGTADYCSFMQIRPTNTQSNSLNNPKLNVSFVGTP